MKRAFDIDVLVCARCQGPMRLIACVMEREALRDILRGAGFPADSPAELGEGTSEVRVGCG